MISKYVTCLKCKRVHYTVSKLHAQEEIRKFNEFYDSLSLLDKEQLFHGTHSSLKLYKKCSGCGDSYKKFRDAKGEEIPIGSTINSILEYKLKS